MADKKIKITDRESLTEATKQAHINAPAGTGSWIAKIDKRAEIVSQPAWDEIVQLRTTLEDIGKVSTVIAAKRLAKIALDNRK